MPLSHDHLGQLYSIFAMGSSEQPGKMETIELHVQSCHESYDPALLHQQLLTRHFTVLLTVQETSIAFYSTLDCSLFYSAPRD